MPQKEAVAVGSQSCDASLAIHRGRLRSPSEHRQLCELGVEIDDGERSAFHIVLRLLMDAAP